MIILDSNVLSEMTKPAPTVAVVDWFETQPRQRLFTTTITQAEMLYGLEILPKGKRRSALESAMHAMFEVDFAERILPFDTDAARQFPFIAAYRRALGRPIALPDAPTASMSGRVARDWRLAILTISSIAA